MKTTKKVILEQQAINRKLWAKENGRMHHVDANKLIAEFMDLRNTGMSIYEESDYKYHTSWDWLMPVVEKISDIKGWSLNSTLEWLSESQDRDGLYDIEGIFQAVVEFIQTQTKDKDKEEALKYLSDKGYAVGSLWHIDDIQQGIECEDDIALKILNESLESDNVCEAVYEAIDYIALNEYKLKIKE